MSSQSYVWKSNTWIYKDYDTNNLRICMEEMEVIALSWNWKRSINEISVRPAWTPWICCKTCSLIGCNIDFTETFFLWGCQILLRIWQAQRLVCITESCMAFNFLFYPVECVVRYMSRKFFNYSFLSFYLIRLKLTAKECIREIVDCLDAYTGILDLYCIWRK